MLRWIKLAVILLCIAAIVYFSFVKINNTLIKNIEVVNLVKLYEKDGFPVYAKTVHRQKLGIFIKDITLVKNKNSNKEFTAFISKDLLKDIKIGSTVFLPKTYDRYLSKGYFLGNVSYINKVMDWQTGFYLVTVTMPVSAPDMTFYSGKVVYKELKNIIMVPIRNIVSSGGEYYAWLADGDKAKRVKLKTGVCDGYSCEVVSGLKVGDRMISSDTKLLADDLFLNVVNDNASDEIVQFSTEDGASK